MSTRPICLRCNYLVDPLGLHDVTPELSWRLETEGRRHAAQSAYRIRVSDRPSGGKQLWDSGRVQSDATTGVRYEGKPLKSRQRAWWRVEVWDERKRHSTSAPAFWENGLLHRNEWIANWISGALAGGPETGAPSPFLRKTFVLKRKVRAARLYATALGLYEFQVNGHRIGNDFFTPGLTDYGKRVQYQVYDITSDLKPGPNAIGAILGDGWYCGHIGMAGRGQFGDRPRLLAQIALDFEDGSCEWIATDTSWRTTYGPIVCSDFLMGEEYDARQELPNWSTGHFDDAQWQPAVVHDAPAIELSPTLGPRVRATQELTPIAPPVKLTMPWIKGPFFIFDLGQNMVGSVRLHVRGPAGQRARLRFAEMLNPDGTLYTDNLALARATDHYVLRGDPKGEIWMPRFTFHGFRYVELSGVGADLLPDAVTGVVLHSDTPPTGSFSCSEALINQLQQNIDWGQRGNFLEIPTDCPQRSERLGWTGDAQVFCRTAAWNRDVQTFFRKWLRDVADAQGSKGEVPSVVPHGEGLGFKDRDGGPAWADAAVICPWTMYLCYGDKGLIAEQFPTMLRFIDYMESHSRGLIRAHPDSDTFQGYGDWLALDGSSHSFGNTPKDLIGTAMFAHCTDLVGRMARILGRESDAQRCGRLATKIRRAYQKRFLTVDGLAAGGTQTSYVLTLWFDLAAEKLRPKLMRELVRDIELRGNKLSTGFVGTVYLPHVLTRFGRADVAYKLLQQKEWPSWLYAVTQGATTIWERWDGWTKEKGFQSKHMNSFNHYAYGAIGSWLYEVVAGIAVDPDQPGYKRIRLAPRPGGGLTSARGSLMSVHGEIVSAWHTGTRSLDWEVEVPPNTSAVAVFPVPRGAVIKESGRPLGRAPGVSNVRDTGCELAAGRYKFRMTWTEKQEKDLLRPPTDLGKWRDPLQVEVFD